MNVLNLMRLRVRWSLLLRVALMVSAVGLFAEQAAGQTAAAPRVLVMPFSAEVADGAPGGAGGALWLGEAAAVLLAESLPVAGLPAIGRDERVVAFDRLQLPVSPALTRATMLRVAELIGASDIVFGEVTLGRQLTVHARILNVPEGRERDAVRDQSSLADIFGLFDRVAARLVASAGRRPPVGPAPARPPALPLEAFEHYVKGLVAAAPTAQQRFLEAANTQVPEDPRILTAMWRVYTSLGMHDKALATANAVPASSPLGRKARFEVALSLIELRRLDGAFKELTALHTAAPSPAIANAIGVVQLYRGTAEGGTAAVWFARANDLAPGNTDYLFNLGYAHALAQTAPAALQWLREAVRHDAANGDAHLVMSEVLASTGRTTEAQRELDLARLLGTGLEVVPSALSTRITPGLARLEDDLVAPARMPGAAVSPAQTDQRETALFHLGQGRTLFEARRDREAIAELRRAIYLAPYEDEPHILLGRLYQRGGRLSDAVDEFKVAIWCRETSTARLALASALLDTGDREGARREAERALALAPGSADARDLLRRIGG